MKKFILAFILLTLIGCMPVRYVDVSSKHNYYKKHRMNTYTSPTWIPGRGIILETHIHRLPKRSYAPKPHRGRN